jgi:hypothetical protein
MHGREGVSEREEQVAVRLDGDQLLRAGLALGEIDTAILVALGIEAGG